jgi:hypothetical protein
MRVPGSRSKPSRPWFSSPVFRGLTHGIPHARKGEYAEGAGPEIDVFPMRHPLAATAGVTACVIPAMA